MSSGGYDGFSPRPGTAFSPRYTSDGHYATATANVSSRKHSFSKGSREVPKRERARSYSYYWAPHGDSDEDEIVEVEGVTYVLPARTTQSRRHKDKDYYYSSTPGYKTDKYYYAQGYPQEKMYPSVSVRYEEMPPRSATRVQHHRRQSSQQPQQPPPQRPSTARPGSSHHSSKKPAPAAKATEADAKRHHIPSGYSLKNWDPTEEPIMLLGSVFDANSLGKWIYDWTVFHHQPSHPISDIAGELWLLLIQLAGKMKRSEEVMPRVRSKENRDMIEDFIESGERLTDKLRKLLKTCETPMLKASKRNAQLGKNSGVEFVKTLFGREQELEKTEKFMQAVRLWNLRFDANCEAILKNPTL